MPVTEYETLRVKNNTENSADEMDETKMQSVEQNLKYISDESLGKLVQ